MEYGQITEGWLESNDGSEPKRLDRILNKQVLDNAFKQLTLEGSRLNAELANCQKEISTYQEELNKHNETLVKKQDEAAQLKSQDSVELSSKEQLELFHECEMVIANYFEEKPEPESPVGVEVCLYGFSGAHGTSVSADAKFQVCLNDPIRRLAEQAAKYWGLDPSKVFFLDRDERVIPEGMVVADIVLPRNTEYIIRHKDYVVTLVKAGTEVDVVDPLKAKGDTWNDFTFKEAWLKDELKKNRESRGDMEVNLEPVDPSTIPSLAELTAKGHRQKARRLFDTKTRVLELATFIVLFVLYYLTVIHNYDAAIIEDQLSTFTHNGASFQFSDIRQPEEVRSWIETAVFDTFRKTTGYIELRGLSILGELEVREYGVEGAPECNVNGPMSQDCYKLQLCALRTRKAFQPIAYAGRFWPPCIADSDGYPMSYAESRQRAAESGATYSWFGGNFEYYAGGKATLLPTHTSQSDFVAALSQLDPRWENLQRRAMLLTVFVYTAGVDGVVVWQTLIERSRVGNFGATFRRSMVSLADASPLENACLPLVIALAAVVLLMELRRIRFAQFDEEKEYFSVWTVCFVALPASVCVHLALLKTRITDIDDSLIALIEEASISSFNDVFSPVVSDYSLLFAKVFTLLILNLLLFRYVLGWFPQLGNLYLMIIQVIPPIAVVATFVIAFLCSLAFVLHVSFAHFNTSYTFALTLVATTMRMALGGNRDWEDINRENPVVTTLISVVGFFVFTLVLRSLPIAIMVAYKKQLTMEYFAPYHPLWAGKNPRTFDPSHLPKVT
eukprot:GEMP01019177.1.p1 GENE.GEMP01019177.1~~GEMP01019177.1.p1  ORF type:complete len:787 (+),score=157.93 GEMP01019177.1:177-2537(+)